MFIKLCLFLKQFPAGLPHLLPHLTQKSCMNTSVRLSVNHLITSHNLTTINLRSQSAAVVYKLTAGSASTEVCWFLAASESFPTSVLFYFPAADMDGPAALTRRTFLSKSRFKKYIQGVQPTVNQFISTWFSSSNLAAIPLSGYSWNTSKVPRWLQLSWMLWDHVRGDVMQLHPTRVNPLQATRVFPALLQVTELREQPPVARLPAISTSLVTEHNLHWGREGGQGGSEGRDNLLVSEHIKHPPRVLFVLQGASLILREAGVLQVPVANHSRCRSLVEWLSSPHCPRRVSNWVDWLFTNNYHVIPYILREELIYKLGLSLKCCIL